MNINSIKSAIIQKPSPNLSDRQGYIPDMICCHQTSGKMSACINWFKIPESRVSAHFGVAEDGTVYQFVPIEKMAWANGTDRYTPEKSNHYSKSLNKTVKSRKTNANFYTVSIEFENDNSGILTESQYRAGLELMQYIIAEIKSIYNIDFIPDREHIIGHYELSPVSRANCPGMDFPFERFIRDLNEKAAENTVNTRGYTVTVGTYPTKIQAENIISTLTELGIPAFCLQCKEDLPTS